MGECDLSGRIPPGQFGHRTQCDPWRARAQRKEAAVPRVQLHLSQIRRTAHPRRGAAHRGTRAHERAVCAGKDCGHPPLHDLPAAVRLEFYQRDAHEPVRAGRFVRPGKQPRAARAAPQGAHRARDRRGRGRGVGDRDAAPRVSARGRPRRGVPAPDAALRRRRVGERGHGRGFEHQGVSRDDLRRGGVRGAAGLGHLEAGRNAA